MNGREKTVVPVQLHLKQFGSFLVNSKWKTLESECYQ
jgi:hypothetical protein